jgi:alkanesulfonate monooxygenase SsuD/methylene tetrahydromethanopterin reductase-like flavin-dependent oxidoreductase (luciferase family)
MRLGTIHLGNLLRHAPLTAKMAATLDVVSAGRLELFLEPAWREREHVAYGYPWPSSDADRVRRLGEAIDVMQLLWTGEEVSYRGSYYQLDRALCRPTPVRRGGPRIWLGEAFDEISLDLVVARADVWNSMPASPSVVEGKLRRLDDACRRAGREPRSLVRTLETQVLVYRDEREGRALFERFDRLRAEHPTGAAMTDVIEFVRQGNPRLEAQASLDDLRQEFVIGTPDEVVARLQEYADLGIEEVFCWFMDYPDLTSMRLLAQVRDRVLPAI